MSEQTSDTKITRRWITERRRLVALFVVLLVLISLTAGVVVVRFEADSVRLYIENLHVLVRVASTQLEETFQEIEKFIGLIGRSGANAASTQYLQDLISQVVASLSDHGVVAVALVRPDAVISAQTVEGRAQQLVEDQLKNPCRAPRGQLCVTRLGTLLMAVAKARTEDDGWTTQVAVLLDWRLLFKDIQQTTTLDRWSKAFILDTSGALLAWPDHAKQPGFKVVDDKAGCSECHRDLDSEPIATDQTWSATTLEIANEAYMVATAPAHIGTEHLTVGVVAPRNAAMTRTAPLLSWGALVLLILAALVGSVLFRLHRIGSSQVRAVKQANAEVQRLNAQLEHKVEARTQELIRAHSRTSAMQRQHAKLDRLAAVGELAATFAHEIRTPLNALSIASQRLLRMAHSNPSIPADKAREVLDSQNHEVEVINSYVEDYLQFTRRARADADGQDRRRPEPTAVDELLQEVVGYVSSEARRNRVEVRHEVEPAQLEVKIDQAKLRHVLVNLVLNAVQVQPDGGEVEIQAAQRGNELLLEVRDRGPGIQPELVGLVFEAFRSYREGGTGLGLAICARLVKEEKGEIEYQARAQGGSIFALRWPV